MQCNAYTQLNTIHFVPKWRQYRNIFCICKLNVNQFNAPKNPQEHTLKREKTSCICASKLKITENIQHVLLSAFLILPMKHEFQSWLIHSCDYNRGNFMTKLGICFDLCYGSDFFLCINCECREFWGGISSILIQFAWKEKYMVFNKHFLCNCSSESQNWKFSMLLEIKLYVVHFFVIFRSKHFLKKLNYLSSNVLVPVVLYQILRLYHILQMFNTYRKYYYSKEAVKW